MQADRRGANGHGNRAKKQFYRFGNSRGGGERSLRSERKSREETEKGGARMRDREGYWRGDGRWV
eukprot:1335885-Amorphochlora_amoeboformis.AAC.1